MGKCRRNFSVPVEIGLGLKNPPTKIVNRWMVSLSASRLNSKSQISNSKQILNHKLKRNSFLPLEYRLFAV